MPNVDSQWMDTDKRCDQIRADDNLNDYQSFHELLPAENLPRALFSDRVLAVSEALDEFGSTNPMTTPRRTYLQFVYHHRYFTSNVLYRLLKSRALYGDWRIGRSQGEFAHRQHLFQNEKKPYQFGNGFSASLSV